MRKTTLIILLVMILIPCVMAGLSDGDVRFVGKQKDLIDIKEPCFYNNTYCSSDTQCNITVYTPNHETVVDNAIMSYNVAYFNYTLNRTNTTNIGIYEFTVACVSNDENGFETSYFKITPSGSQDIKEGEGISLAISMLVMLLIFGFLFAMSFRVNNNFAKYFLLILSILMLLMIILYSVVIVQQTLGSFVSILQGFTTFFYVLKVMFYISIIAFLLFSFLIVLRYYKFKRGMLD